MSTDKIGVYGEMTKILISILLLSAAMLGGSFIVCIIDNNFLPVLLPHQEFWV